MATRGGALQTALALEMSTSASSKARARGRLVAHTAGINGRLTNLDLFNAFREIALKHGVPVALASHVRRSFCNAAGGFTIVCRSRFRLPFRSRAGFVLLSLRSSSRISFR